MTLQNEIKEFLGKMSETMPPETARTLAGATQSLQESGLIEKALQKNDTAPQFTLPNINNELISSSSLLPTGPLALSFFRGSW